VAALREQHDLLLLDLDGTLYRGGTALPGATEELADAARLGCRIGYLTNNGSRSPTQVVAHLRELGFIVTEEQVATSGQAATTLLTQRLPAGAAVLVVGTDALAEEVGAAGLRVVHRAEEADAVVQGHSAALTWAQLAEGCLAIRAGALWVACNVDATLPDERGELPGNGAMVAALRTATGAEPLVAGKPEPAVYAEAVDRFGAKHPLVVGDRLETDILGARRACLPSLLVLTGVTDATTLLTADEPQRPTYLGADLTALRADPAELRLSDGGAGWRVRTDGAALRLDRVEDALDGPGGGQSDPIAALRALCAAHWAAGGGPAEVRAGDDQGAAALDALGLNPARRRPAGQAVG
jgi:HAD superfamily hydrolase (TIGR01450 family)